MADRSEYKVGVVLSCEEVSKKGGKPLKVLKVDVGNGEEDGGSHRHLMSEKHPVWW
jgi:hypothetical protein